MFPQGKPGIGLLLLRLSVAAILLSAAPLAPPAALPDWLLPLVRGLLTVALCAGALTPVAAPICLLLAALALWTASLANPALAWLALPNALALLLLGPGAYSVDAWLFGRRRLILPSARARRQPPPR